MTGQRFVIFANARTGSTSLAKLLGESKDVKMSIEPFHPKYPSWNPQERNYSKFITNKATIDEALNELFQKYTALKVLQYQFPFQIYFQMLKRQDLKILFLTRKSKFDTAISGLVAEQTAIWQKEDLDRVGKGKFFQLNPVPPQRLVDKIDYIYELETTYRKFLEENRTGDFMELIYENLFSESEEQNKKMMNEICSFLKVSLPPGTAISKYMKISNSKINSDLYQNLPNYQELLQYRD